MVSSRRIKVPAIAALIWLVASGCSGNNKDSFDPFERAQNRPPVILKDSLTWSPEHTVIQTDITYSYSVRAVDPDFGDRVVKYWWRFGGGEGITETTEPTVEHAFTSEEIGSISVKAIDSFGAVGPEETFFVPWSPPSPPPLTLTVTDLSGSKGTDNVAAGVPFVLSFVVPDVDADSVVWSVSWGDGSVEEGMATVWQGTGATVSLRHVFAESFAGQTLTVAAGAIDNMMSGDQRRGSITLRVAN